MTRVVKLEEPFKALWANLDVFKAVDELQGDIYRAVSTRRTLRTEFNGRGYFVKIHKGVGWREILKNLLTFRLPVLGARSEWEAIKRLNSLGIDTMRAAAFGQRGWNPAKRESFLITEELAPTISLEDYCHDWPQVPPEPSFKRALIKRVAQIARRMHQGGVNHRDFYLCHLLLHLSPPPDSTDFRLSVIDLHRAQLRPATPRRWQDKDLAGLNFSALNIGLTQRDRLRFLRVYFEASLSETLHTQGKRLNDLERESNRLLARYTRKYAPRKPEKS
ncbi:MAG TPA: lipopolysaccharide core heptose(I) kinase RfaP [Azoarcus taiwanensis]|nr:lipopolysaccharide core heptose(I) kinase RfaP [Azoarcus taiwanensis]